MIDVVPVEAQKSFNKLMTIYPELSDYILTYVSEKSGLLYFSVGINRDIPKVEIPDYQNVGEIDRLQVEAIAVKNIILKNSLLLSVLNKYCIDTKLYRREKYNLLALNIKYRIPTKHLIN